MEASHDRFILIVDDEEPVRRSLRRVLEADGYGVLDVAGADAALALLAEKKVHLVISDQNMPGMSGIDLLKLVGVRYPRTLRIMLTADKDPEVIVRSINEGEVYRFIRKPWNNVELRTILHFAFRVVRLEEEREKLVELVRRQQREWKAGLPPTEAADLETELLFLAEEEARES